MQFTQFHTVSKSSVIAFKHLNTGELLFCKRVYVTSNLSTVSKVGKSGAAASPQLSCVERNLLFSANKLALLVRNEYLCNCLILIHLLIFKTLQWFWLFTLMMCLKKIGTSSF